MSLVTTNWAIANSAVLAMEVSIACCRILARYIRSDPRFRHALKGASIGVATGAVAGAAFGGPVGMAVGAAYGGLIGAAVGSKIGETLGQIAQAVLDSIPVVQQTIHRRTSSIMGTGHRSSSEYELGLDRASNRTVEDILRATQSEL